MPQKARFIDYVDDVLEFLGCIAATACLASAICLGIMALQGEPPHSRYAQTIEAP